MKKKILIISVLLLFLLSAKCGDESEDCHRNIKIINNSDMELRIYSSFYYPDSITNFGHEATLYPIMAHSDYLDYSRSCLEVSIPNRNEYGVLMYYIFDNKVLDTNPIDTIIKYKMYLKKYDLTVEYLQNNDWTITYP